MADEITPKDSWRGIILFGLNTATYKLALAKCLMNFADAEKTTVTMGELAEQFFDVYVERLQNGKPQILMENRQTVMERVVNLYSLGKLSRDQAILRVENDAFGDVIPRFHKVDNVRVPDQFYEHTGNGLVITDSLYSVLSGPDRPVLESDISTRWDLLEAGFELRRHNYVLQNDLRRFYLDKGYERTEITHLRPALNGYQKRTCFYCGEEMGEGSVHVDHVIPRQVINHDEVWNLVLAHRFCNEQKSDHLPSLIYIEQLIYRNEFLIKSNHPLKNKIIEQLGVNPVARRQQVMRVYHDAEMILGYTWEGVKGYNPRSDPLYHIFVKRSLG